MKHIYVCVFFRQCIAEVTWLNRANIAVVARKAMSNKHQSKVRMPPDATSFDNFKLPMPRHTHIQHCAGFAAPPPWLCSPRKSFHVLLAMAVT